MGKTIVTANREEADRGRSPGWPHPRAASAQAKFPTAAYPLGRPALRLSERIRLSILVVLAAALGMLAATARPAVAAGPTPVSGTISSDTTWMLDNSPYIVVGNITVAAGATLTVEPGVEVRFSTGRWLQVSNNGGSLVAQGTASQPITFTSSLTMPVAGSWRYLYFAADSTGRLAHCGIGYAGANNYPALDIRSAAVQIDNCRIHHSQDEGVRLTGAGLSPSLRNTRIEDNGGNAITQNTIDMTPSYQALTLSGNGADALVIPGGTLGRNISLDGSPAALGGAPIRLTGNTTVAASTTLTVRPGSELRFDAGLWLQVNSGGALQAVGTASQPIVFTGASAAPVSVVVPQLQFDAPANGVLRADRDVYYRLNIPAGVDTLLTANLAGQWQGELYRRYGQTPDRSNFDFRAESFQDAQQRILLTNPPGGDWYVLLHGLTNAGADQPFSLLAESRPFLLFDITPEQGGNAGQVTANLTGVGFTPGTAVSLQGSANVPGSVTYIDDYHLVVTFDLAGVITGTYSLQGSNVNGSDTLADAFAVVEGTGPRLESQIVLPGSARPLQPFLARVFFENSGDANMPAPMLRIQAPAGGSVRSGNQPSANATDSLQFLAIPTDSFAAGVLAPGNEGIFEFWGTIPASGSTTFSLTMRTSDDATPLDLNALRDQVRPADPPLLWDDAWNAAMAGSGGTYGDFVTALIQAADEAKGYGLTLQSVRDLLGYRVDRAMLGLPADIRGRVQVLQGGKTEPLARGTVSLVTGFAAGGTNASAATHTWYDGSFALRDVAAGDYTIDVAGHYSPTVSAVSYSGAPITGLDFDVLPGGVVNGYVRSSAFWWSRVPQAALTVSDGDGNLIDAYRPISGVVIASAACR